MVLLSKMVDLSKYQKAEFLGRGSFGDVYKYEILPDSTPEDLANFPAKIAVKKMRQTATESFNKELKALSIANHENVLRIFPFPENASSLKLALDFCHSDLGKVMSDSHWNGSIVQVRPLALQIARGIGYLHGIRIVHLDIKPGNILLQYPEEPKDFFAELKNATVKISDFGLSRILEKNGSSSLTTAGTDRYMSPEMARAKNKEERFRSKNRLKTDVFSTGIVFFRMRYGKMPFKFTELAGESPLEVSFSDEFQGESYEGGFQEMCAGMLRWDVAGRSDMDAVLGHEFFGSY